MTKSFQTEAQALVDNFAQSQQLYAKSLILTIFGDTISAHGGSIWLGSLIKLIKPLGINQRLVRTSVFRLIEKDILHSQQIGRRSFYSLTEKGFRQMKSAAERIYCAEDTSWDGEWRLVFTNLNQISPKQRESFQKELTWLGFCRLSNGIYGHPTVNLEEVRNIVNEMRMQNSIVLMQATNRDDDPLSSSSRLAQHCFKFDAMESEYQEFIDLFAAILCAAQATAKKDGELCFLLRTLLILKFRGILLHEAQMPRELVPADCLSHRVREITSGLYQLITNQAEDYFIAVSESAQGTLPKANEDYHQRFGGLKKSETSAIKQSG